MSANLSTPALDLCGQFLYGKHSYRKVIDLDLEGACQHNYGVCEQPAYLIPLMGFFLGVEPGENEDGCHLCNEVNAALADEDALVRMRMFLTFICDEMPLNEALAAVEAVLS